MSQPETFKKTLFGGGARSSAGYRVYFNSHTSIEYADSVDHTFVSAEGLVGRKSMALYPEAMTVGSPRGPKLVDESRRKLVIERVQRAAAYLGWTLE